MVFDNSGGKIKSIAKAVFYVGVFLSIVGFFWLAIIARDEDNLRYLSIGLIVLFGGSVFSWINSVFIYGFGSLIESNEEMVQKLKALTKEDLGQYEIEKSKPDCADNCSTSVNE